MITAKIPQKDLRRIHKMLTKLSPRERGNAIYDGMALGGRIVDKQIKRNLSGPILKTRSNKLKLSIQSFIITKTNQIKVLIGSGVRTGGRMPYANIHEAGGKINVSSKMARFAWIMYKKTKNSMWKAIALLKGRQIKMPDRRYLSKSLNQVNRKMVQGLINTINEQLKKLGAR